MCGSVDSYLLMAIVLFRRSESIHFHAWGQAEMLELLTALQRRYALPFEVEAIVKRDYEMICVLRKQ
jgi:hypothetical protein